MITVPNNFIPRDYQLKFLMAMDGIEGQPGTGKKRAIFRWHRRAGKDTTCFAFMAKSAWERVGNYFYIFPTKEMARKALWEHINKDGKKMLDYIPADVIARLSNQEMLIVLTNGSTIRVVGYDKDPDSIRGVSCTGAVLSEYAFSDPDVYRILGPSIRETEGWIVINSTPNGRNHFYDLWERVKDSDRWFVSELQTYWPDNPNYSGLVKPNQFPIIMEEEDLTVEDTEREYGVSFSTGLKGSIYIDQLDKAREQGRIGTFLWDDTKPVNTFWDIGQNDKTCIWFAQQAGNTVQFIDFWEGSGLGTDDLVRMLKAKGYEYKNHYLPHDAAYKSQQRTVVSFDNSLNLSMNDFKCSGMIQVVSKTKDKLASLTDVRKRFSLYCFDSIKCVVGLRHLELYHRAYDKKKNIFSKDPVHDEHSNAADALRTESESQDFRDTMFLPEDVMYTSNVGAYSVWD